MKKRDFRKQEFDRIKRMYRTGRMSIDEIARAFSCDHASIKAALSRADWPMHYNLMRVSG